MENNIISVNLDDLALMSDQGGKLVFDPKAEDALVGLLRLKELVEQAYDNARHMIQEEGLRLNESFASVEGTKVKCTYQASGSKYYVDASNLESVPADLYQVKTAYSLDTKSLEKWAKENGGLPLGIKVAARGKHIVPRLKAKKDD